MSLRDLAVSMMTVSDNASADALLDLVGLRRLAELLESFGLQRTWVRRGTAANLRDLQRRTGLDDPDAALAVLADNDRTDPVGVYEAANASASSPRDMTLLLRRLWAGELLSAEQTAFVQATMHRQVFQHRMAVRLPARRRTRRRKDRDLRSPPPRGRRGHPARAAPRSRSPSSPSPPAATSANPA